MGKNIESLFAGTLNQVVGYIPRTTLACLVATSFGMSSANASEMTTGAYIMSGQVSNLGMIGYINYMGGSAQKIVVDSVVGSMGKDVSLLTSALATAQARLDKKYPNVFVLSLVPNTEQAGSYDIEVALRLGDVVAETSNAEGYSERLAIDSVPSLKSGTILKPDQKWEDERDLRQANFHPFKRTKINYKMSPDTPVVAEVEIEAEKRQQFTLSVDNYGSFPIGGRGRVIGSYVNGNLTGNDDILRAFVFSGLSKPKSVNGMGFSYYRPFYGKYQALEFSASKVKTNFPDLPLLQGGLTSIGNGEEFGVKWHFNLPQTGAGEADAPRFSLGIASRKQSNVTTLNAFKADIVDYEVKEVPVSIEFSDTIRIDDNSFVTASVANSWGVPGRLGSSDASEFEKARTGADRYSVLKYHIHYNTRLAGDFPFSVSYKGQATSDKLTPANQMQIGGPSGVRGFTSSNGQLAGDSAQILNVELGMPAAAMGDMSNLQPYLFYDVGHKKGGSTETDHIISSVGLGIRWEISNSKNGSFGVDAFAAKAIRGRDTFDGEKPNLWIAASAKF